jgi:hypothetical protein
MTPQEWVEIIVAATIPLALIAVFFNRWHSGKNLGVRAIQMLAAAMLMPSVIVLAMEKILDGAAVAALVGGAIGYLFANISDYDRHKYGGGAE